MEDRRNAASGDNSVVTSTSCYVICLISNSKNLRKNEFHKRGESGFTIAGNFTFTISTAPRGFRLPFR